MMDTCFKYSCKWRFQYNSSKCAIMTFNETKKASLQARRSYTLGDDIIKEVLSYSHLGVTVMPTYISSKRTSVYTLKLRKTFFGLLNCAFHDNGLNPNTCRYIYSHIVLPKALYGCECLYTLTKQEKLNLERDHRLCVKSF